MLYILIHSIKGVQMGEMRPRMGELTCPMGETLHRMGEIGVSMGEIPYSPLDGFRPFRQLIRLFPN